MKVLGIVASPRKGKLTDKLVDSALGGLKDGGFDIEKIYLSDVSIKPCAGCLKCQATGRCILEDDFYQVSEKLRAADVVVFGSPTYFSGVTSMAKALIDRGFSMFKENAFGLEYRYKKPRKAILITSCDAPFPFSHLLGLSTGCMRAMKVFFGYMRLSIKAVTVTNAKNLNARRERRVLKEVYDIGKKM
ncbi:MAG: flavodoxin family protein [Candidatus Omnitrophica bacterium]|nr:flavodoxin family protein [Candidatus Omnitrophota bacterium]